MDFDEMKKAMRAVYDPKQWDYESKSNATWTSNPVKERKQEPVDYIIVDMDGGKGGYIIARARGLGATRYDCIASCSSYADAWEIVRTLNEAEGSR